MALDNGVVETLWRWASSYNFSMEVIFTSTAGERVHWDGVLWSSTDLPVVAQMLNRRPMDEPGPHVGEVDVAAELLRSLMGPVSTEVIEQTGWPVEHLGAAVIFVDPALADEQVLPQGREHDSGTQSRITEGALAKARALFRGSVCANGAFPEDEDWERPEREWTNLLRWAEKEGLILTGPGPQRLGGREHDCTFDTEQECWIKFTKPDASGFTVDWGDDGRPYMRNASPSEYLDRIQLQNDLLEDRIELLGLWQAGRNSWRIVTQQPDVPGTPSTMEEIRSGMERMGFVQLRFQGIGYEYSSAWRIGHLVAWDLHPSNVMQTHDGLTIPIDVIITSIPGGYAPEHFHTLPS